MKRLVLTWVAVAAFTMASRTSAQLQGFEDRRSEALDELVGSLEDYAEWCRGKKLFLQRKGVLELLLDLDPENGTALRALGYTKDSQGRWVAPARAKKFRDFDKRALEDVPEKYQESLQPFLDLVHEMLRDAKLSPDQHRVLIDDILRVAPDDPELRSIRGEVEIDGRWVPRETPVAAERRAEIEELVRAAFEQAPEPELGEPNGRDSTIDVAWSAVLVTPTLRVLTTGDEAGARRVMKAVLAAVAVHTSLFGRKGELPTACTIYLVTGDQDRFLASHPAIDDEERARLSRLSGSGISGTSDHAFWDDNEERRLDGIVRTMMGYMLSRQGITLQVQPWIHEGFGLYLSDALIGTRLSWFLATKDPERPEQDAELRQELLRSPDWMKVASQMLRGDNLPRVRTLVTKPGEQFTTADLLYSYVLAGYLLEAKEEETRAILSRIGAGRRSVDVLEDVLGMSCEALDDRVRGWVHERAGGSGSPGTGR